MWEKFTIKDTCTLLYFQIALCWVPATNGCRYADCGSPGAVKLTPEERRAAAVSGQTEHLRWISGSNQGQNFDKGEIANNTYL